MASLGSKDKAEHGVRLLETVSGFQLFRRQSVGAVKAEREAAKKQTRSIFLSDLKESVTAGDIAKWFGKFGDPVHVSS